MFDSWRPEFLDACIWVPPDFALSPLQICLDSFSVINLNTTVQLCTSPVNPQGKP